MAVARYFNTRQNLIVPNISWGMFLHECDMLVVTKAGYAYEIEIKVSKSDLKADMFKKHGHNSRKIKRLYFAIPEELINAIEYIPERAGIIVVKPANGYYYGRCYKIREAAVVGDYKFTAEDRLKVAMLGTMRMWNLKENILRYRKESNP